MSRVLALLVLLACAAALVGQAAATVPRPGHPPAARTTKAKKKAKKRPARSMHQGTNPHPPVTHPRPAAAVPQPAPVIPNDPWWAQEWAEAHIDLPALWGLALRAAPPVIAVVDTGVEQRADLAGAVLPGVDVTTGGPASGDAVGHGTMVAEAAAARGDNRVAGDGACWRCAVLPVVVAPAGSATGADLARGIRYAVDHGAAVVNVSLVLSGPDAAVADAVGYAVAHGVPIVAAAGNDGGTAATYPAAYPGVLSVVGTDTADGLYSWSTHGPWATVAAPGCVRVADAAGSPEDFCGSSAAAGLVSGVVGVLISLGETGEQAVGSIAATAAPVSGSISAHGRVDGAALARSLQ